MAIRDWGGAVLIISHNTVSLKHKKPSLLGPPGLLSEKIPSLDAGICERAMSGIMAR